MIKTTKTTNGKTYEYWQHDLVLSTDPETGQRKKKTFTGKTKAAINKKIEAFKKQFYAGKYVDTKQTLGDYLSEWLAQYQHEVKPRTYQINKDIVKKHIVPRIGNVRLADLNPQHVQKLLNDVRAASAAKVAEREAKVAERAKTAPKTPSPHAGVRTAQQVRQTLVNALNHAVRLEVVPRNVAEIVEAPKMPKAKMELWTVAETVAFLDSPVVKSYRLYALAYLALLTGMRRGELLALKWSDLSDDSIRVQRTLTVVDNAVTFSTPKTDKGNRVIYLESETFTVLEAHRDRQALERQHVKQWYDNDLVFPSENGKPMTPSNFTKAWKRLLDKAGVRYVSPHKLRHAHASLAIMNGADAVEVADRLGHARASFTQDVYTHVFAEQRQRNRVSIRDLLPERGPAN